MLTREQVLASAGPEALFGSEALKSRRALRKRYAELVKVFSPEKEPECFRRIRDAYEGLGSHFELVTAPGMATAQASNAELDAIPIQEVASSDRWRTARFVLDDCSALLARGEARQALDRLDASEAQVRPVALQEWAELMSCLVSRLAWDLDENRIERAFEDLDDPEIQMPDPEYWAISSRLSAALAWRAARVDESLPAPFRDALYASRSLKRAELAALWHRTLEQIGADGMTRAYERLAFAHPGLVPCLYVIEDEVTGVARFTRQWEFRPLQLQSGQEHAKEIAAIRKLRNSAWAARHSPKPGPGVIAGTLAAVLAVALIKSEAWQVQGFILLGLTWMVVAIVALWQKVRRDPNIELRQRCLALVRERGLFRHEVLAEVVGRRLPAQRPVGQGFFSPAIVDPLVEFENNPPTGLALLSEAHLRRIEREQAAEPASDGTCA